MSLFPEGLPKHAWFVDLRHFGGWVLRDAILVSTGPFVIGQFGYWMNTQVDSIFGAET